ncbi:MAG: ornithine cyclodeaminase family protein [Actinomycetota bacterium]
MTVRILTYDDVEKLLDLNEMLSALEHAFVELSAGKANVPPRVAARTENGLLGAMPGFLPGVALETKLVTVFPANHERGLPSHRGVIAMFDEHDGAMIALMDAIHITAMRTAGGAAVSTKVLAREDARVLAILGAGAQGRSHLATLPLVRNFTEIRVVSRTPANATALAALDERARVVDSFEEAVRSADVVSCCTDAREPIVRWDWFQEGTHVTSVGGTFGPEVDVETIERGRIFVEWRGAATNAPPAGAQELQGVDPDRLTELGEVLAGTKPGRVSHSEITVYKSTGHAVEDAASARIVFERAVRENIGSLVEI